MVSGGVSVFGVGRWGWRCVCVWSGKVGVEVRLCLEWGGGVRLCLEWEGGGGGASVFREGK